MAGADVETPNTLGGLPSVNWEGGLLSWAALHFVGHGRVLTLHVEIEQRARTLYRFF